MSERRIESMTVRYSDGYEQRAEVSRSGDVSCELFDEHGALMSAGDCTVAELLDGLSQELPPRKAS